MATFETSKVESGSQYSSLMVPPVVNTEDTGTLEVENSDTLPMADGPVDTLSPLLGPGGFEESNLSTDYDSEQPQLVAAAIALAAPIAIGPILITFAIGAGLVLIIHYNREEIGRITNAIGKGIVGTLDELRQILSRAGSEALQQYERVERVIREKVFGSGALAIQRGQLVSNTARTAEHLARLLRLSDVGGVPPGEDPDPGHDNDKHWWQEIKNFLKAVRQAIKKGAGTHSRKQALRELAKGHKGHKFTEAQIREIERRIIEAAKKMGDSVPDFLPK